MESTIPGHSKEAGLAICKQLDIDPEKVLGINIFVLHGTVVIKTVDGDVNCHLIPDKDKDNELIFRIVKDESLRPPTMQEALLQETDEVGEPPHYPFGTTLQRSPSVFRYARAGTKLKANKRAYAHFSGNLVTDAEGRITNIEELKSAAWADIRSRGASRFIVGVPLVNVDKGQCFWILTWAM